MATALSYSAINTKIKAMSANLISSEEYRRLSSLETTADFIAFLKNHPGYRDVFKLYDEHQLHRFDAERIFINSFYLDYAKIYRFASMSQRRDMELIFTRHEVTILKNCIHRIFTEENTYDLSLFQEFFNKHSGINVAALAASQSMDEYIKYLQNTEYHQLFVKLQNANYVTPFDYEMQLDIYYFKRIWKIKDKLASGDTLRAVTCRLGTEIDLLNIMWIYRSKIIYDINPNDILSYIIPVNYKLTKEQLMSLAKSGTVDEFMALLKNTHYKSIHTAILEDKLEDTCAGIISNIYKENLMKYPASMNAVNYYLYQKEEEISRLTTALECIRYGLEPQDKLKYILKAR